MKSFASSFGTLLLGILGGVLSHFSMGVIHADPSPKAAEDATFKIVRLQGLELVTPEGRVVAKLSASETKDAYNARFWLGTSGADASRAGISMYFAGYPGEPPKNDPGYPATVSMEIVNDFRDQLLTLDSRRIGIAENFRPQSKSKGPSTALSIEPATIMSSRRGQPAWYLGGPGESGARLSLYDFNRVQGIDMITPDKEGERSKILLYDENGEAKAVPTK